MARNHNEIETKNSMLEPLKSKEVLHNYSVSSMNRKRLVLGFGALLIIFVLLVFKMGKIQIVRAEEMQERATAIQTLDTDVDSKRGAILDAEGNILAQTVTRYELYVYTSELYNSDNLSEAQKEYNIQKLAKITGVDEKEVEKKLKGKDPQPLIATGLTRDQVKKVKKNFEGAIVIKTTAARDYPNGAFAAQILGNLDSSMKARSGLELQYNSILAGSKGRTVKKTDRQGNTVSSYNRKTYQPVDGYNIETTIDSVIQKHVEDALEKGMERTGASSITCIVMNPKTGDILAYAETPEYDPNKPYQPSDSKELAKYKKLSQKEQSEYLSRMWTIEAVSSIYEPGSTFKLIAASAGLELGTVTDASRYTCNGTINVNGTRLHCTGVHGTQDINVAVGHSCNPALAKVALDMGGKGMYQYAKLFGLTSRTGVDLPNEESSMVKDVNKLTGVDLATMGYGQGIAVTPIQLITAINAMGNDGVLMKPKVVKRITDSNGKTVKEFEDVEVRQVLTKETADRMCEIMEYYVEEAGGTKAYVSGYRVGGKTGTANIASGGGYSSATDTSFVAMAPMEDPVISMLVIVHKPTKMSYGNNTAGPIIKEIMSKCLPYLGVEKKAGAEQQKAMVEIPNVTGMDSDKAISLLKSKGFKIKIQPEGSGSKTFVVQDQYPKSGNKANKGTTVYIYSE
ncbi:MAG: penicillin-binding transpeptidase domain-containing protein [Firmicutes bacterium]|nr:penicillin-binding transpeptidase domain-containing protein [Bacillota bacterium]